MAHSPKKRTRRSPSKAKRSRRQSQKKRSTNSPIRRSVRSKSRRRSKRRSKRRSRRRSKRRSRSGTRRTYKMDDLVDRLKAKKWQFYGANWCGYTKKQIDELGGDSKVKGLYVDCEKNESKCKQVEGLPSWKQLHKNTFDDGFKTKEQLEDMLQ